MLRFAFCILYLAILGLLCFPFGRLLARRTFDVSRFPFRTHPFEREGRFYDDVFHIRRWQARVPDMSRLFTRLMPAKRLTKQTAADLPRMIAETCVAELTHTALSLCALAMPLLWRGAGGAIAAAVYILLGNLPFIIVQRYNRPRLQRLFARQRARNGEI